MLNRRTNPSQLIEPVEKQSSATSSHHHHHHDKHHGSATANKLVCAQARILKLSLLVRIAAITLLIGASNIQQAFDTSHELLSYSLDPETRHGLSAGSFKWILAFVRWDTVYFVASACPSRYEFNGVHRGGYGSEQSLAFQPGIVGLLRVLGYVTPRLDGKWSPTWAVVLTAVLANAAAVVSPVLLFRLSWKVTNSVDLAYTAAVLSVFAPSAGTTLASPTPESFFSVATLYGLLSLETAKAGVGWAQLLNTSFWFAVATLFRTNGVLLIGYIAFKLLRDRPTPAALKLVVSATLCMLPNVMFQLWAYSRFCVDSQRDALRPWCREPVPSVYTFVQSHYWNVGVFRYWEAAQLPNFVLATPVLLLIAHTARVFWRGSSWDKVVVCVLGGDGNCTQARVEQMGLCHSSTPKAVPYIVHGVVLGVILLVASHVQIALRFATPGGLPMVWWGASHMVLYSDRRIRSLIVGYLSIQVVVLTVLYAGFYPPA